MTVHLLKHAPVSLFHWSICWSIYWPPTDGIWWLDPPVEAHFQVVQLSGLSAEEKKGQSGVGISRPTTIASNSSYTISMGLCYQQISMRQSFEIRRQEISIIITSCIAVAPIEIRAPLGWEMYISKIRGSLFPRELTN